MRSQLDVRRGVVEPQVVHLPPGVVSLDAAVETIELADAYGLCDGFPLDESQRFTLRAALGEREDGSWAAATVADFEPRQNGKNDTCAARELAGLILFGERLIIHTAHEFPTANEAFLRLVGLFENWDDLRRRVARVRYANGEQGIELLSGQRLKYRARTGGSGRGFAMADLVVYDEAQHLQAEHLAASGPARLANPNSQGWYMGSGGLSSSRAAWRLRRRALGGDGGRFAYVEHTAESPSLFEGRVVSEPVEVGDRAAWALANPAFGRRITDESLQSLLEELGPELFARECLCVWDGEPDSGGSVVDLVVWAGCADVRSSVLNPVALAVDVTPGHDWASVCAAGLRADGLPHVEVLEHRPGVAWLPARVAAIVARLGSGGLVGPVVVDPAGPAGAAASDLESAGVAVRRVTGAEHAAACGRFLEAVLGQRVRHLGQSELVSALSGASKRPLGDAWAWSRRNSPDVDISPLVGCTLALWAFEALRRAPVSGVVDLAAFLDDEDGDDEW